MSERPGQVTSLGQIDALVTLVKSSSSREGERWVRPATSGRRTAVRCEDGVRRWCSIQRPWPAGDGTFPTRQQLPQSDPPTPPLSTPDRNLQQLSLADVHDVDVRLRTGRVVRVGSPTISSASNDWQTKARHHCGRISVDREIGMERKTVVAGTHRSDIVFLSGVVSRSATATKSTVADGQYLRERAVRQPDRWRTSRSKRSAMVASS